MRIRLTKIFPKSAIEMVCSQFKRNDVNIFYRSKVSLNKNKLDILWMFNYSWRL